MNCSGTARMNAKALWAFFQSHLPPEDDFSGEDGRAAVSCPSPTAGRWAAAAAIRGRAGPMLAGWAARASPLRALFGDFLAFGVRREGQGGIGRCLASVLNSFTGSHNTADGRGAEPRAAAAGHGGVRRGGGHSADGRADWERRRRRRV